MQQLQTEILVIGGGATGTGVARDLAMRGFKTILLEKGDLTHGTTGRYHGLLHSGGRYAVKDPHAARECIEENRILRKIMPHCIEDTGGFFVLTPWDDADYAERFVAGCRQAGIPVEEISPAEMLRQEPLLNPRISRCFRVPDGSADSFAAADANAASALEHQAQILVYHPMLSLLKDGSRVVGALCYDRVRDEQVQISADLVVNAAGAWCGKVAASAGLEVKIIPGKGTMLAINHRIVNTVINRCKLPSDGDILVPAHTVSVIGTTDMPVPDPDHFGIEPWEVNLMLEEGEKLIPGFREMRILRAWAGVRPLYQETASTGNRDVTRAFTLLDHETRDGVSGLVTITSGKWTTYRKMAEVTVDFVCKKLGTERPCRTHLESLPGVEEHGSHFLGTPLARIEKAQTFGDLICECELATTEDIEQAIVSGKAATIDDVRRDARLGMGPCQGGFCSLRVAGLLQTLRKPPVEQTNAALRDFLQERWKGLLSILWGQQLRQERLDDLIYLDVLSAADLPGPAHTSLAPALYAPPGVSQRPSAAAAPSEPAQARTPARLPAPTQIPASGQVDVLVVGMGLAGLTAAWQAASHGRRTRLIAKGFGANHWGSGCIDVLGFDTLTGQPVDELRQELEQLIACSPQHPYALVGMEQVEASLKAFQALCEQGGYPMLGSLEKNWRLPTALGSARRTCLAPATMVAGDMASTDPALVVGFKQYRDFYPELVAANLTEQGIPAQAITLDLPVLGERRFVTARTLAAFFELEEDRHLVAQAIRGQIGKARRVGLPAVLGLNHPLQILRDLENQTGLPVFEIPGLPPSIPGIRLHNLLSAAVQKAGGRVYDGMQVVRSEAQGQVIESVWTEAAARQKQHTAKTFILATGGILGGGLTAGPDGGYNEAVFGLPIDGLVERQAWFRDEFLAAEGHPVFQSGVVVGNTLQPVGAGGEPLYANLYVAGSSLAGFDAVQERSLEGVALATGFTVGQNA